MTSCRNMQLPDAMRPPTLEKPTHCQNPECGAPIRQDSERTRYYCGRRCRGRMNTLGISVSRGDHDAKDLGPSRPMFGMTEREAQQARMRNALSRLREGVPMPPDAVSLVAWMGMKATRPSRAMGPGSGGRKASLGTRRGDRPAQSGWRSTSAKGRATSSNWRISR